MTAALAWRAIPLTIFCAGYGNVAMEVLRRGSPKITGPGGVFTPHLRLVANFFRVRAENGRAGCACVSLLLASTALTG